MLSQSVKGFTLIELIMVIVIVGILATMTTDIITLPVKSYIDLERRTTLVDTAEMTLRRMQRDIRRALPNSIRITAGTSLELLHTSDGGRYRADYMSDTSDPDYPGDILDFTDPNDNAFEVIGSLNSAPTSNDALVIYNLGSTGADAYAGKNRRSIKDTSTVDKILFDLSSPAATFPLSSPQQRFFIIDTPITYSCAGNELRRFDDSIDASYTIGSSTAGLNYKLQAKAETLTCAFSYDAGTATRGGLVTIEITLADSAGESAQLIHQVHVDNMP